MIADHRNEIVQHHNLTHAGNLLRLRVIDTPDFAAKYGTGRQRRELDAPRQDIDAEDDFAVDLVRRVEPLQRFADDLEVRGSFERGILRRRDAAGGIDKRRIGEPAAARTMDYFAICSATGA